MNEQLLSIIIPVFNEKSTIDTIIKRVNSVNYPLKTELIVVDDCSTDGSYERLESLCKDSPNIRLYRHEKNRGKGASIRDGFKHANGDIAIIQDADLEYDPQDIPKVVQPILDGYADVVYGSRFAGHPRRALYYWHSLGNKLLTFLSNIFTNLNLTDMETCYKAFKKLVYKNWHLTSDTFTIEPEMTAKAARMRQRIYEVPISYRGRSYFEGKKIGWEDGVKALFAIIRHSLFSKLTNDVGFQTLELMSATERYNGLIYKQFEKHLGERVLEVGSGIGNITKYMLSKDFVLATDVSESYLTILENTFENSPNIKTQKLDLNNFQAENLNQHEFDTVVCLNVLEHIKEDSQTVKKFYDLLKPGGNLILLVPAHQAAFNNLDKFLGHHKRYKKMDIESLALRTNFQIEALNYFNMIGFFGWFVSGSILRKKTLSKGQLGLFNLLLPFLKIEKLISPPFGLSLITVLKKE